MRIVVTGGAGFIGANLCRVLGSTSGIDAVIVVDDLSTGSPANVAGLGVGFLEGSILDAELLDDALAGADAVVHLAGRGSVLRSVEDPLATNAVNVTGTLQVLEAVRRAGKPHVVLASSSSVYGANPSLPRNEDDLPMPMSPYAVSKLATEQYALAHARAFGLDVLAFRFFNVFGPLQPAGQAYSAVVPAFIAAALDGRALPVHGDGLQTRDFTYVESVCSVIADALVHRVSFPGPVNLAFGNRVSLAELVERLAAIVGHDLEIDPGPPRAGDVREGQADQTRLRSLFPAVVPVPLDEGLARTVSWHRASRH